MDFISFTFATLLYSYTTLEVMETTMAPREILLILWFIAFFLEEVREVRLAYNHQILMIPPLRNPFVLGNVEQLIHVTVLSCLVCT